MLSASLAIAASLFLQTPQDVGQIPPSDSPPQVRGQAEVQDGVVQVDDVVVTGRRLDDFIRDFVGEVANPAGYRGLARWSRSVCVGTVNMSPAYARYLIDRVSQVALQIGLNPEEPGCDPDIVVIVSSDGETLARNLVGSRKRIFRNGMAELDAGQRTLDAFQAPGRPVRWWLTSLPVDARTGARAIRLDDVDAGSSDLGPAGTPSPPILMGVDASLLRRATRDDLTRAIVILDKDELGSARFEQVADYIALVSLVQIDPNADASAYPTILNLFSGSADAPDGLTDWDMTYLTSLYDVSLSEVARGAQVRSIASSMERERRRDTAD